MKFLWIFLIISQSAFAIDSGNGSDGACNITGGGATQITAAKRNYQCTSLNIDANLNDFKGTSASGFNGAPLVIKVLGNVTIQAGVTVDFSGQDGNSGTSVAFATGGRAGAGGFSGGSSTSAAGSSGSGAGAGSGGNYGTGSGITDSYGGGGGGGSYKTTSGTLPTNGNDNDNSISIPAGANGATYGSESSFDISFDGGSGGAAGGGALASSSVAWFGSSGGGGGGALRIIAGGDIEVNGTIISSGGNGGGVGTTTSSGGGGGGSGGAVWLQAGGTLVINASGTITALGGTGGTNDSIFSDGIGGNGGNGRIRLDDKDGVVTINGTVTPAAYSASFTPTPVLRQYTSAVSCAKVALDSKEQASFLANIFLGLLIVGIFHYSFSRKSKV